MEKNVKFISKLDELSKAKHAEVSALEKLESTEEKKMEAPEMDSQSQRKQILNAKFAFCRS